MIFRLWDRLRTWWQIRTRKPLLMLVDEGAEMGTESAAAGKAAAMNQMFYQASLQTPRPLFLISPASDVHQLMEDLERIRRDWRRRMPPPDVAGQPNLDDEESQ
jgi:hypothetical protein